MVQQVFSANVILKGDDLRQNGDFERRKLGLHESKLFSHSHGTNTFHYFQIFVMCHGNFMLSNFYTFFQNAMYFVIFSDGSISVLYSNFLRAT